MKPPIPLLRSIDEHEARDFYLRYHGFEGVFEHRFTPEAPLCMAVRRGACVLHLSEHHGDGSAGAAILIEVEDIEAFHSEIHARGHKRLNPGSETQSWGMREVALRDPFGNRVVFFAPPDDAT